MIQNSCHFNCRNFFEWNAKHLKQSCNSHYVLRISPLIIIGPIFSFNVIQAFVPWVGTTNYPHCLKLWLWPILLCKNVGRCWIIPNFLPHTHTQKSPLAFMITQLPRIYNSNCYNIPSLCTNIVVFIVGTTCFKLCLVDACDHQKKNWILWSMLSIRF